MTPSTDTRVSAGFTPGPWHVEQGTDEDGAGTETFHICHPATVCTSTTVCQVWESREADAHLIAAAPELFEAAEHMLMAHESESATHYAAAIAKLRTALTKARAAS